MFRLGVVLLVACAAGALADDYLSEVGEACKARADIYTCGKFEVLKYIHSAAVGVPSKAAASAFSIVNVAGEEPQSDTGVFPNARQLPADSELNKLLKFAFRQVNTFMNNRAVAVHIPESARLIDLEDEGNEISSEARGRKKRKVLALIPLLVLFKLVKVKVMLAIVLLGVLFIKKAVILLALLAPSLLHTLKMCKTPHVAHHEVEEFAPSSYGYGHTAHGHGGYDKTWAASRAYNAHRP